MLSSRQTPKSKTLQRLISSQTLYYETPEFSIVVPTYNERENIIMLLKTVYHALEGINFNTIVVDDGSKDQTADLCYSLLPKMPRLCVIRRKERGLASAIFDGMVNSSAEYVAVIDADLQHPPELLREFLSGLKEGYDIVIGSRYVKGGKIAGWNAFRKVFSRLAILLAHIALPKTRHVADPVSGFFALRKSLLDSCDFDLIGYKLLMEILVKCDCAKVKEVPINFELRRRGKSKLSFLEVISYLKLVSRLVAYRAP